ncbi:hypothetical protein QQS21_012117 [Conoideocrella luteorostrata]|uniref:Microbial-type PARG catalytic domain-containing protein n=1 Tax=Conoideocrella luteorostrata TaxID=1105319 RepID=A0AAJ0FMP3_9HYPO|nr:hypothetical protein QQS21_012117 [Conoideocrella luteorostrata]
MAPGSRSSRVKPSEVAADTKRNFIPIVQSKYGDMFPPYSMLYSQPTKHLEIQRHNLSTRPPVIRIEAGDPVMAAISYASVDSQASEAVGGPRVRIPFICAANERRPGGDWETGCSGYEEKLCRRSNLSATLSSPWPHTQVNSNYPIPSTGGILSDAVVVCRGPHDHYERLERWHDLPVVSVPPARWPKLKESGTMYSFAEERDMMKEKIRGALRICLYNNYDRVVIGDFGLGNSCRNPPQEVAQIWRDVLLFDPDLRGQFTYVVFSFEDPAQSTTRFIWDEMARKDKKGGGSGKAKSRAESSASAGLSRGASSNAPTDMAVFQFIFNPSEIERVLRAPDPRYGLDMITS